MSHDNLPVIPGQLDLRDQLENFNKGTIKYIVADVRTHDDDRNQNKTILIPHCCNDIGVMGAGVAKALKDKWPSVLTSYQSMKMVLGNVGFVPVENNAFGEINKIVVNMIGQAGVRGKNNKKPVRYAALLDAMRKIVKFIQSCNIDNAIIHTIKFGSDLAGGDWRVIEALIEEIWIPHMDVTICVLHADDIPLWRRK